MTKGYWHTFWVTKTCQWKRFIKHPTKHAKKNQHKYVGAYEREIDASLERTFSKGDVVDYRGRALRLKPRTA